MDIAILFIIIFTMYYIPVPVAIICREDRQSQYSQVVWLSQSWFEKQNQSVADFSLG